jgi:diaminohydroxyphosphoribosylaminopyrimidine deaminase / 5-amino-6-(5-phosphoribosylamino)uracil reductase
VFDRRLRTPAHARVFSTLSAGPVIILTSRDGIAARVEQARALEAAGATILPIAESGLAPMFRALLAFDVHSLLLEGGAAVHAAAWDEGLVDCVHLYVAPRAIGPGGVPLLDRRPFSPAALVDARVEACGADVVIEGYVHRFD